MSFTDKIENILVKTLPSILAMIFLSILGYIVINHGTFCVDSEGLMTMEPIFFSIASIVIAVSLALNINEFRKYFSGIKKETWVILFLIVLIGFGLRQYAVPHTHRIFFDEDLYSGIANSIATEGRNILCNYGTSTHCIDGILNKDPSGWPFILSIFYRILGSAESLAFYISTVIGTLSIVMVFLLTFLLFRNHSDRNEEVALFSALLFALVPAHLIWSGSIATEVPFAFLSMMTILAYLMYSDNGKFSSHLLGAGFLAFTIQIRPEGLVFMLPIIFAFLIFGKERLKKLSDYKFWIPIVLVFLLITPHLMHLYINREGSWGAPSGKKFGIEYAIGKRCFEGNLNNCIATSNLIKNFLFWFSGTKHPAFFPLLGIVGLMYLLWKREKQKIALFNVLWFMTFFTVFAFFYAGGVDNGGIGFRFINIYFVPTVILGGYGAFVIGRLLGKITKNRLITTGLILILIFVSFIFTLPFVQIPDKQAQYARDMHDILVMPYMDNISENCYVLTHNPSIFLVEGKNSLQTWFGQNKKVMDDVFNETDCVMWLEGAWCAVDPNFKKGICKSMHDNYELEVLARHVREENPDQTFTIYRVYRK